MKRCNLFRPTATSWLNALADNGMLRTVKTGHDRLFIYREFLQLLVRREPDGRRHGHVKELGTFSRHLKKRRGIWHVVVI